MTEPQWQERLAKLSSDYQPMRNVEHFEALATEDTTIRTLNDFYGWCQHFKAAGCFRGQTDAAWHLYPSFYRKVYQRWSSEAGTTLTQSVDVLNPEENELTILKEFQRAAHHHYPVTAELDQVVDWLALMQHHGAPTRMLDWTRSPYVALYFAMQGTPGTPFKLAAPVQPTLRRLSAFDNFRLRRCESL